MGYSSANKYSSHPWIKWRGFLRGPLWTVEEKQRLRELWDSTDRKGSIEAASHMLNRPENGIKWQATVLGLIPSSRLKRKCLVCGSPIGWHARKYCSRRCKALDQWKEAFEHNRGIKALGNRIHVPNKLPLALRISETQLRGLVADRRLSIKDIAVKLDASYGTVHNLIKKYDIPLRGRKLNRQTRAAHFADPIKALLTLEERKSRLIAVTKDIDARISVIFKEIRDRGLESQLQTVLRLSFEKEVIPR